MAESILQVPHTLPAESLSESFFTKSPTDLRFKVILSFILSITNKLIINLYFQNTRYDVIYPRNSIQNSKTILFEFPIPTGPSFYLLDKVLLSLKMQLVKRDDTKIDDGTQVAPINLPLTSVISNLSVELNDVPITPQSSNYNYKAYLDTLLNYDSIVKDNLLQVSGYFEDVHDQMDATSDDNLGFALRRDLFSTEVDGVRVYHTEGIHFIGNLNLDFTSPCKPILNGVKIKITMTLADNDFILMTPSNDDIVYKLTSCNLICPIATLTDDMYSDVIKGLEKEKKAFYNYLRRELININIAAGTLNYTTDTLFSGGKLPAKMVLAFVKTEAYQGNRTLNPYNFFNNDLDTGIMIKKVNVTLNGSPIDGFELPINDEKKKADYLRLHLMTGLTKVPYSNSISLDMFNGGYVYILYMLIYYFNLQYNNLL